MTAREAPRVPFAALIERGLLAAGARLVDAKRRHRALVRADGAIALIARTWAKRAREWAAGGAPDDLKTIGGKAPAKGKRDVFIYMISGAKVRAPAAAMALIERLK